MKAEFLIENIEGYLSILSKILPIHSQIPVLANLLIEANKEGIYISSTNLETGVRVHLSAKVEEEGATTVPGKQFIEALSSLPKDKVLLTQEKDTIKLTCRGDSVSFQTIARDEFPSIYEEKGEKIVEFSEEELRKTFSSLIFAASLDESRPELTGVLLSQKEDEVDFVATDGFRLSFEKVKNKKIIEEDSLILPSKVIAEALSLKSPVAVFVYKKANQVIFEAEDIILVSRLISGNFPNYQKVIPMNSKTKISFDVAEFAQKLRLISIFARDTANVVRVRISEGKIIMKAASAGVGEGDIEIEGKQEGEENEIAFNIKFLSDLLKNTEAKEISMQVSSPIEPALFKTEDPNFLHVIMPVRVDN